MLIKRKIITLLLLLNCILMFIGFNTNLSSANNIFNNEIFSSCKTELLWNYTMGDSGRGLAITPDGRFLAVGSFDGKT